MEAPTGTNPAVPITAKAAKDFAYYNSAQGVGVLGPRGWYCFGMHGPGGETLFLSPQPIDPANIERLTYKGRAMVEYRTPAEADGLGTYSWLKKNASPIDGVAILVGPAPDLLLLSVRLPSDLTRLTSAIVRQVELDAERPLK